MFCPLCESEKTDLFYEIEDKTFGLKRYDCCQNCHLIFLLPKFFLSKEEEKKRYDLHDNNPDDENYTNFLNRLVKPLIPKLTKGDVGLDYGCGPGPTLDLMLEKQGFGMSRYDPFYFPEKKVLKKQYDFIVCTETVEHFFSPRKELSSLNALLKPNKSYLAIMTQLYQSDIDFSKWWYHTEPTHVMFYQKETFKWIAEWLNRSVEFFDRGVMILGTQR